MPAAGLNLVCRAFRPIRTLTDGAGGFLPGVPLGWLGMVHQKRVGPGRWWWMQTLGPGPREGNPTLIPTPAAVARS